MNPVLVNVYLDGNYFTAISLQAAPFIGASLLIQLPTVEGPLAMTKLRVLEVTFLYLTDGRSYIHAYCENWD